MPLWEVPEEYQPGVRKTLANAFGVDESVTGFAEIILEAAKIAAEDNLADYLPDLISGRKNSYLEEVDEITGGKGVIFSTGTPVSNSMVELYTMQRYLHLQYDTLVEKNLQHFDAWASTFGETVTALEIAPEGNGYRLKTRFARFYNLPELLKMFREVADIQTADMLNLPVPEAEYRVVKVEATDLQWDMVEELGNMSFRTIFPVAGKFLRP